MEYHTRVLTDEFFHSLQTPEVVSNIFGVIADGISLYEFKVVMDEFDSQVWNVVENILYLKYLIFGIRPAAWINYLMLIEEAIVKRSIILTIHYFLSDVGSDTKRSVDFTTIQTTIVSHFHILFNVDIIEENNVIRKSTDKNGEKGK